MINFQFLLPEFKPLAEPAGGAEQLVYSDPRACVMRTRHAKARRWFSMVPTCFRRNDRRSAPLHPDAIDTPAIRA
jgi:hypothetical protein